MNALLDLVKRTPFEKLADIIRADNEIRDRHISCLQKIMIAYSYITCVLESNPRSIAIDDTAIVNKFIDEVVGEKNKKVKEAANEDFDIFHLELPYENTFLWAKICYQVRVAKGYNSSHKRYETRDELLFKSSHWDWWRKQNQKSEKPLTTHRLQEDLWDVDKMLFRYDKLPDFVKNYPWAFPPNVAELHKELIEREKSQAP